MAHPIFNKETTTSAFKENSRGEKDAVEKVQATRRIRSKKKSKS